MPGGIDRIHGPQDGVVELIIVLQQDWESDPFVVKTLRDKVALYQEYLMGVQFRSAFANCRGVIVLETRFFPPEEIQRILAKEGVEIRISSDISESSAPAVVYPSGETAGRAPATSGQAASRQPIAPVSPQVQPIPLVASVSQPGALEPWEVDDEVEDIVATRTTTSSVGVYASLGLLGVFVVVVLYALVGLMSTPPESSPRSIGPQEVTAQNFPPESHATISVRPDRNAFVVVPIQDRAGKEQIKYHILFGVKDSTKLLVFATFADSQIPVRVEYKASPSDPENKEPVMVWGENLDSLPARAYTGRLERLKRYDSGPLELKLPGGNQDINQLYKRLNRNFPMDSMLLVVGEKPTPPRGPHGIIFLVGLLGCVIAGGVFVYQKKQSQRSF